MSFGFGFGTPHAGVYAAPSGPFTADFTLGSVPAGISYTQATPYTYFNSSGLLVTNTGNRFDYDPVTLAIKGLLIEPATTNLVLGSNPTTTSWAPATSTTLTGSASTGLDNTTSASQTSCTVSGVTTGIYIAPSVGITTVSSTVYTLSVYLAYSTSRYVYFEMFASTRNFTAIVVDLQTGTITQTAVGQTTGGGTSITSGIDAANNATVTTSLGTGYGYYRVWFTYTANSTVMSPRIGFVSAGTGNTFNALSGIPTYTSTGTEKVNVYGMQLEASSGPTSLIPTTTAAVARGAGSIVNNGFSWYNASAGTAICVFDVEASSAFAVAYPFSIGTATSNGIAAGTASSQAFGYFDANQTASLGSVTRNTQAKVGMAYDGSTNAAVLNGGTVFSPSQASITTPTGLILGGNQGTTNFAGHIKSFTYYPSRLTNAQLQTLTT